MQVLRSLLPGDWPKTLVEVGAHNGVTHSNSRPFVEDGWATIAVEPHPVMFERLVEVSTGFDVRCVNAACSSESGVLPMFLGKDDPETTMSTLCTDDNPWFHMMRGHETIDVQVRTLTDILEEAHWPGDFSTLLVDAEGMDYETLVGLDFDRFRPRIVVTEEYISNPAKHRAKFRLLMDRDYTFHSMVGSNTFWIANEHVEAALGL